MGRDRTGAITIGQCVRLNISYLFDKGILAPGAITNRVISWNDGSRVTVVGDLDNETVTLRYTIAGHQMDYSIELIQRPSNLGKGFVYFFKCPVTCKACRFLYLAYDSPVFMCPGAYDRLYYPVQIAAKKDVYNAKYWHLKQMLDEKFSKVTFWYNGEKTRRFLKLQAYREKLEQLDELRCSVADSLILKFLLGRKKR